MILVLGVAHGTIEDVHFKPAEGGTIGECPKLREGPKSPLCCAVAGTQQVLSKYWGRCGGVGMRLAWAGADKVPGCGEHVSPGGSQQVHFLTLSPKVSACEMARIWLSSVLRVWFLVQVRRTEGEGKRGSVRLSGMQAGRAPSFAWLCTDLRNRPQSCHARKVGWAWWVCACVCAWWGPGTENRERNACKEKSF